MENRVVARYTEGTRKVHGGCEEGYGMVARCAKGKWSHC